MGLASPAWRPFFFAGGVVSLILGAIGVLAPIMPTTPFAILAAYCFSKSSPKIHQWILSLPYLGEGVKDWEEHRVIRPRAKVMSMLTIILIFGMSLAFAPLTLPLQAMLICIGIAVSIFILSRRSYPRGEESQ